MSSHPRKLPRDPNSRAFEIVRLATGQTSLPEEEPKDAKFSALGKLGGVKGGKARAKSMTAKQRKESARRAALARWKKAKPVKRSPSGPTSKVRRGNHG